MSVSDKGTVTIESVGAGPSVCVLDMMMTMLMLT